MPAAVTFDFDAFANAVDRDRRERDLTWFGLADALWDQSAELNARRTDHPL